MKMNSADVVLAVTAYRIDYSLEVDSIGMPRFFGASDYTRVKNHMAATPGSELVELYERVPFGTIVGENITQRDILGNFSCFRPEWSPTQVDYSTPNEIYNHNKNYRVFATVNIPMIGLYTAEFVKLAGCFHFVPAFPDNFKQSSGVRIIEEEGKRKAIFYPRLDPRRNNALCIYLMREKIAIPDWEKIWTFLATILGANHIADADYHLRQKAGLFFQGGYGGPKDEWIYIEILMTDAVDELFRRLNKNCFLN